MVSARRQEAISALLEQLPEKTLVKVQKYIEDEVRALKDPVFRSLLNAPLDDEPLTAAERRAIAEAREDFANGRTISHEEMMRLYGPTPKKRVATKTKTLTKKVKAKRGKLGTRKPRR